MKQIQVYQMTAVALLAAARIAHAEDTAKPLAAVDLVFDEVDGIVSVEAEHFHKQTLTDKRAWHITSSKSAPDIKPDGDAAHVAGASGGAYLEILPDTRGTRGDKMIHEENFTEMPGALAVAHYKVNINTPARYYVWLRSFSTGSEDNGIHVGLDGQWPESGRRWQTVNKKAWAWDCKQRTEQVHTGVPMQLFLDIEKAGEHEIMFSMREDGFEMDKIILSSNKDFKPEGQGPVVKVKSGNLPAAFPQMNAAAPGQIQSPVRKGAPPAIHRADLELAIDPATGGQGRFAAEEIRREAISKGMTLGDAAGASRVSITVAQDAKSLPQSYQIKVRTEGGRRLIDIRGTDAIGAMYGGLDIAEAIRNGTVESIKDSDHKPHIAKRGIKFNIPLDLRTPSYTDTSDSGQANIPEVWERDFWIDYLDAMARHRYNVLSLWSLHPFPSLVKVPEFPEVALDDVWRTRAKLDDNFSLSGQGFVRPGMLANHEVVKRMTMDEKITFWRWVMQQAADRGIQIYIFTWNVFTFGADGKHGITNNMENEITKKYFRASIRETVKTYPLLAGIGITAGEGMPHQMDPKIKEAWLWDTYGEGVRDALKDEPDRKFNLIHRFHWTAQGDILDAFKDYPGTFDFSFKYSVAHMYSITKPPFIQPLLENMAPGMRTWLTVRNDDIYTFRFGDPAYAREYILNIPPTDKIAGFYMGPDGYTWGRDFLERNPATSKRPLVMEKQWYSFMLWGRLAYEPSLPDSHFENALAARHPKASSQHLFRALQGASQVMPLTTRFFWKDVDFKWFPEACVSHPKKSEGFYTVRHFMEGVTMPGANVLCIRDWRTNLTQGKPMEQTTPLEIATALDKAASVTFASLDSLRDSAKGDTELRKNITDCEALAWLGRYYAAKIRGACALALFDSNMDKSEHETALRYLGDALAHWKKYAAVRDAHYVPALYNRVGDVNVTELTEKAAADIDIARNWKPGTLKDDGKRGGSEKGFRK